jgi:hypothetical protein
MRATTGDCRTLLPVCYTLRVVKRLLLVVLACAACFGALPNNAQAGECGLPGKQRPLWIDFADGNVPYWPMFAKPGVIAAAANFLYPAQLRARGAKTVYWEMNLRLRVGTPMAPMDAAKVEDWADRVFFRAVASSSCATPWIALNEMWGANLATPWSPTNAQYRANLLSFVRRLSALGARPFLLLSTRPFTDGEATDWWRQMGLYTSFVREVYFTAPQIHRQGAILGSRNLRRAFRTGITDLASIGVPVDRMGLILGFHTNPGQGGREGLKPASAWYEHIKLQVLAVKQVAREMPFPTIWSWGWGEWSPGDRDPDKPGAACVWLWTRNPKLCNGPAMAGPGFDRSLTEGQLRLPDGVQCKTPWANVSSADVASAARVTGDREIALSSMFAHVVLRGEVPLKREELRAAQRAVIAGRFSGSVSAYRQALARARATPELARSIVADELRKAKVSRHFAVRAPSGGETADFYDSVSAARARLVEVSPAPAWLAYRRRGVAIEGTAPFQVFRLPPGRTVEIRTGMGTYEVKALGSTGPLGAFPLDQARSGIRAVLMKTAREERFNRWLMNREVSAHAYTTCRADWLPAVGTLELTESLPFLALAG